MRLSHTRRDDGFWIGLPGGGEVGPYGSAVELKEGKDGIKTFYRLVACEDSGKHGENTDDDGFCRRCKCR